MVPHPNCLVSFSEGMLYLVNLLVFTITALQKCMPTSYKKLLILSKCASRQRKAPPAYGVKLVIDAVNSAYIPFDMGTKRKISSIEYQPILCYYRLSLPVRSICEQFYR